MGIADSTTNTITISGSATDDIAGLDPFPYRYTIGSGTSSWLTADAYTSSAFLAPNTQYDTKFEARDAKGHIAGRSQSIYTRAMVPTATVDNPSSYIMDVGVSDENPPSTQYQISVNGGASYVTQEGGLTSAPAWITLTDKKVTVTGLTPSTAYTFQARARNGENIETAMGSPASGTTLMAPPGSPANIIATATDKSVTVSWDGVSGAIGYDIEADGTIDNTDVATTYTHIGLNPGTPHTYRVRARNEGGAGNWSSPISKSTLPGSPDIPANLSAIPLTMSVTVTWSSVPGATGYDIEVDGTLVTNGPNTNYIHSSLAPGTHHAYRVRSINPGGKSPWSGYVNATTLLDTSPVPTSLTALPARNSIALSWDAVGGTSGYDIEVDGVAMSNGTRTTYTHSGLSPDTQHIYRVRAKKGGVTSEWSAAVIAATLADAFGTPTNFKAHADDTSVRLSWDGVPQAAGYDVEADGMVMDNGTGTTAIHNGLSPNSVHTYRVRARSESATSPWSEAVPVTTFGLPAPANLTAISDETTITSVWQAVYGAESYELEFDGSTIQGIIDTSYTITGLAAGSQHSIRVRAVNGSDRSNWTVPVMKSTLLGAGNVPRVSGMSRTGSITVMWSPMEGAASYDVEADGAVMEGITATSYSHTSLEPGTGHTYRVRARDGAGAGEWSLTLEVSTLPEGPAVPTGITASSNMTSIMLTWDRVAGAEEYEVEADGQIVGTGTETGYLHAGLASDTVHTYRVRAKNGAGYGSWSGEAAFRTLSSVQTFDITAEEGEEFGLVLSASDIQDLGSYTFTVRYDSEELDVVDLCGLTARQDVLAGAVTGTDITVTQVVPGTIVFVRTGSAQSWQTWSGTVNSIRFRAKKCGQSTITYTIQ